MVANIEHLPTTMGSCKDATIDKAFFQKWEALLAENKMDSRNQIFKRDAKG